jgi:hypothetical protein
MSNSAVLASSVSNTSDIGFAGDWTCPLTGKRLSVAEVTALDARREQVRATMRREILIQPLVSSKGGERPEYWNKFSTGRVHLY